MTVSFLVPGIPQPGGSKRAFAFRRANGKLGVRVTDDAKGNKPWRAVVAVGRLTTALAVKSAARDLLRGLEMLEQEDWRR